jgi:quercetin dioxygenase-like cupin family protein
MTVIAPQALGTCPAPMIRSRSLAAVAPQPDNEFDAAGYVGPTRVFTRRECRRIVGAIRRSGSIRPLDWPKGLAATSRLWFELANYRPIVDRVTELIGPDVMLWGVLLPRRRRGAVHPWHTDIETSAPSAKTVSVWLGLAHTSRSASLRIVSRSHRFGATVQQVAHQKGRRRGQASDAELAGWAGELDPESRLIELNMGDGEAIFFDGRLWHGSRNENLLCTRTALLFQYASTDTPIRIPDPERLHWPFRILPSPRPACIMMRGTDRHFVNRTVPAPPPAGGSHAVLSSQIRALELPLAEDTRTGWKQHGIFRGATSQLSFLSCHASVLTAGTRPHSLHGHADEELLIALSGEVDLRIGQDAPAGSERVVRLRPGSFVYYPANQPHTLSNPGPDSATYLMFKWLTDGAHQGAELKTSIHEHSVRELLDAAGQGPPIRIKQGLNGRTRHLRRLTSHVTTLQPGAGYAPHTDAYDVAIVTLSGTVETLGQRVEPHGVIFYPAGEPHGMRNVGDTPAVYLVFEFHGSDSLPTDARGWRSRIGRSGRALQRMPGGLLRRLRSCWGPSQIG